MGAPRYRTRLDICSIAVAVVVALAGMTSPAAAQVADSCEKLDNELVTRGTRALSAEEKKALEPGAPPAAAEAARKKAHQLALDELANRPSPLRVKMEQRLSSPGETLVTFEDKRIDALTDASKICIRAFARHEKANEWTVVPVKRIFVSEKAGDTPKRLNVILEVDKPASGMPLWPNVKYLTVGGLAEAPRVGATADATRVGATADPTRVGATADPTRGGATADPTRGATADATPAISFSHAEKVWVISKLCAFAATLLFVGAFYLLLIIITYNKDTQSVEGPCWLAYTLSPIRISAAWFGEASMSQVQLLVFTFVVAGLLFYHLLIAGVLSELSTNLLMLIGISAVGTGASKFAQTVKTSLKDQTARYLIGKGWYSWELIPARSHATLGNLLLTDGRLDIYKFQMAIFTVVVAVYVIYAGSISLVDVKISETMLYLIGISQGVYVGGKAVTDRTTDLEAAVQKMIDLDLQIRDAEAKPDAVRRTELCAQYTKAATTAAVEFASLQNRKFPTKFDRAREALEKIEELTPQVGALQAKAKGGAKLTSDEQALEKEFEQVNMTAKELAAFAKPTQDGAVQDPKNIDPAVLKP